MLAASDLFSETLPFLVFLFSCSVTQYLGGDSQDWGNLAGLLSLAARLKHCRAAHLKSFTQSLNLHARWDYLLSHFRHGGIQVVAEKAACSVCGNTTVGAYT